MFWITIVVIKYYWGMENATVSGGDRRNCVDVDGLSLHVIYRL